MEKINVLSLFDGISCGQVALQRVGIEVENYYAYEIEPNAISITQKNFPNTIQCGDVTKADFNQYNGKIDLLMGGSPCQFWSCSKNHTAKNKKETNIEQGLGWELFKQYVKALNEVKPKYFLYENNYRISQKIIDNISKELGVKPILINSGLVSAQNRKRLYWTNIPNITQPEDKGILIKDIIVHDESLIKHFDDRIRNTLIKSTNYIKYDLGGKGHYSQQDRLYFLDGKAPTVPKSRTETKFNVYLGDETYKKTCPIEVERLQTLPDNYTEYGTKDGELVKIPKTNRFEAVGNGWTVDVIAHILKNIKNN